MSATLQPQVEDFQSENRMFVSGCEYATLTLATCAGNRCGFHLTAIFRSVRWRAHFSPLVERYCLRYNLRAMNLNRALQLRMLQELRESYPAHAPHFTHRFESDPDFLTNLHYLKGHGLLTGFEVKTSIPSTFVNIRITEAGLDFLEDDGGIGAILRTVTVKLDTDQLRQILAAKVEALSIPQEKKASALDTIRKLPAEILNKLVMRFVERGI